MVAALERPAPAAQLVTREPVNVEALLMQAVQSGVAVETMERIMAMRRELLEEQARTAFFTALAGFQADCPVIAKTEAVRDRGGQQVRYKFAPLDKIVSTIQPHLQKFELSYTFNAHFDLENGHLIAACAVHHSLGHTEVSEFRVPIASDNFMNKAQHFGSASSYAKRYALCNALGLLTGDEDDDANGTQGQAAKPRQAPAEAQRQPSQPAPAEETAQPEDVDGGPRERLLERVTALCVELGYDARLQLNSRAKAATMPDEKIVKSVIPSLERLVEQKRSELSQKITAELVSMGLDDEQMAGYVAENGGQGKPLDACTLSELRAVAESLELQ